MFVFLYFAPVTVREALVRFPALLVKELERVGEAQLGETKLPLWDRLWRPALTSLFRCSYNYHRYHILSDTAAKQFFLSISHPSKGDAGRV